MIALSWASFTAPIAELMIVLAIVVVLVIRAWAGVSGIVLTRRATVVSNGAVLFLIAGFLFFVVARFKGLT